MDFSTGNGDNADLPLSCKLCARLHMLSLLGSAARLTGWPGLSESELPPAQCRGNAGMLAFSQPNSNLICLICLYMFRLYVHIGDFIRLCLLLC